MLIVRCLQLFSFEEPEAICEGFSSELETQESSFFLPLPEGLACLSQDPAGVPAGAALDKSSLLRSKKPFLLALGVSKMSVLLFASLLSDKEIEFISFSIDDDTDQRVFVRIWSECSCREDKLVVLGVSLCSASGSLSINTEGERVSLKSEYLKLLLGDVSLFLFRILNVIE